ncbi:MAG: hypothetical protein A3J63_03065 [Candidatus Moranbacteria bacterium RIFCSPHIGHO2_02_FULL_40_12b]|nr:MAG: hypothetical protein A3J63_03065 [Candidatus Moranbacteria bacterium RIFCSPHIGHO2_02_FULL_40_12b]
MKKTIGVLLVLIFVAWVVARIVIGIQFNQNCGGYLKRAADANTVELAKKQLEIALMYIEQKQLTSGYTSIIYRTPSEEVGFWYENLKSSLNELSTLKPDATPLEKSNMLIKLRETLLDEGQSTTVTIPAGISVYPYNTAMAILGGILLIPAVVGVKLLKSA